MQHTRRISDDKFGPIFFGLIFRTGFEKIITGKRMRLNLKLGDTNSRSIFQPLFPYAEPLKKQQNLMMMLYLHSNPTHAR